MLTPRGCVTVNREFRGAASKIVTAHGGHLMYSGSLLSKGVLSTPMDHKTTAVNIY